MDDPETRAILEKYIPQIVGNPQFIMGYQFTPGFINGYDQAGEMSDENLKKIDAELNGLD